MARSSIPFPLPPSQAARWRCWRRAGLAVMAGACLAAGGSGNLALAAGGPSASAVVAAGGWWPAPSAAAIGNWQAACSGVGSSSEAVPLCQQPLTIQPAIPPNIVLMLDDSGSMSWNFMPDWTYLDNYNNNAAVIDSSNNGVYYNPAITYTAPPTATGGAYTTWTDPTNVPFDGLDSTPSMVNLYSYNGNLDKNDCGGSVCNGSAIDYNVTLPGTSATQTYTNITQSACDTDYAATANAYNESWRRTSGFGSTATGTCKITYYTVLPTAYFQYSTGPANGPYTVHYIAPVSQGCGSQSPCVTDDDTSGAAAPAGVPVGQNLANWFAYYHTRIQMAKSGLLTAFAGLDPTYRFGFGSINGNNSRYITSNLPYTNENSRAIANVAVFGDGSSGTQRAAFWSWVLGESPSNSTPLRSALQSVGKYYQTAQPWSTMASDPEYGTPNQPSNIACRQAYTILTTDGFWNGSFSSGTLQGASSKPGPSITGPNNQQYQYSPAAPYSGGEASGTPSLADVATYYWENDLQPGISNEVPPNTADPAFWQHMTTFTMGLGFTPTGITGTAPNGDNPPTTDDIFNWAQSVSGTGAISGFGWPTPSGSGGSGGSIYNIADLEHAGVSGHGAFYSATDPQSFISGIESALKRAAERTGSGASLSANSTQLDTGAVAFQATYHTSIWTGDLQSFAINPANGAIGDLQWSAAAQLAGSAVTSSGMQTYPNRVIKTYNPAVLGAAQFVDFTDPAAGQPPALSSAELAALGTNAANQAAMVNWLRGDSTSEQRNGGALRNRIDGVLGDVIDSQPVYSGAPDPNAFVGETFTGSTAYSAFASVQASRTPLVFVAANDGMLHGFNATTGNETFAYLPGAVITAGVAALADPAYGSQAEPHQDFNDGQLTIADVYFAEGGAAAAWHTVLVGTTGRGTARAVYALDITQPSAITLLWERSAGDGLAGSDYIGQMTGKPVIAQTSDGSSQPAWSVLVGNGYNSAQGVPALLQFSLADGSLSVHTTTSNAGQGLAGPVTWIGTAANGISTDAYAGDLAGQVWDFPLVQQNCNTAVPPACTTIPTPTSTGTLMFTAEDPSGGVQPISSGMLAGSDPVTGNVWLFFGTGKYLQFSDLHNTQVQGWYGFVAQTGANQPALPALPLTTGSVSGGGPDMVERAIVSETPANGTSLASRTLTPQPATGDMAGKRGWYFNLDGPSGAQGEMMVDPNQFQANLLLGTTRIPVATDVCNPSGSGWIMAVNPFSGTAPGNDFFDVNGDGQVGGAGDEPGGAPAGGVGFGTMPNAPIFVGGAMLTGLQNAQISSVNTAGATGNFQRISWREVVNP